jgi:hypothetical protein
MILEGYEVESRRGVDPGGLGVTTLRFWIEPGMGMGIGADRTMSLPSVDSGQFSKQIDATGIT